MAWTAPWQLMGILVSGDVGDLTIYTDRFDRKVPFPRSPPKQPASPKQLLLRARFRIAQANYMATTKQVKQAWEDITKTLSIPQTGQNLFISLSFSQDHAAMQTLVQQSSITIDMPPAV